MGSSLLIVALALAALAVVVAVEVPLVPVAPVVDVVLVPVAPAVVLAVEVPTSVPPAVVEGALPIYLFLKTIIH